MNGIRSSLQLSYRASLSIVRTASLDSTDCVELRVSYNGYYVAFPRLRRGFDSRHPHQFPLFDYYIDATIVVKNYGYATQVFSRPFSAAFAQC